MTGPVALSEPVTMSEPVAVTGPVALSGPVAMSEAVAVTGPVAVTEPGAVTKTTGMAGTETAQSSTKSCAYRFSTFIIGKMMAVVAALAVRVAEAGSAWAEMALGEGFL